MKKPTEGTILEVTRPIYVDTTGVISIDRRFKLEKKKRVVYDGYRPDSFGTMCYWFRDIKFPRKFVVMTTSSKELFSHFKEAK